jgi:transcriptional regulator with XRE-family HTH domain
MKEEEHNMFRLKVKEVAQDKGVSQRQLFLRSGVDITTIRKVFRNPHTVVTVETLTRLARVLNVDVSTLIESVPDSVQPQDSVPDSDQPQDNTSEPDQPQDNPPAP